jgi:hypothetical protein
VEGKVLEYDGRTEGVLLVGLEEDGDGLADMLNVGFFVEDTSRVDTLSIWAPIILKAKVFGLERY